jgi:hypothetical protein
MRESKFLMVVAIACIAVAAVATVLSNSLVRQRIRDWQRLGKPPGIDLSTDPPLGKELVSLRALRDVLGRSVDPRLTTLLVLAGECSECTAKLLNPNSLSGPFEQIIVVFHGAKPRWQTSPNVYMINDAKRDLSQALRPAWTPRFYLLDTNFRLADKQDHPDRLPKFVLMGISN